MAQWTAKVSAASIAFAVLLFVLAGPGEIEALSADPRTLLCNDDCFPVAHPWLLITAAVFAIAGLIGLRTSLKGTDR